MEGIEKQLEIDPASSFNLARNCSDRNPNYEIEDGTEQAFICYEGAANDFSSLMIAILVNYWRTSQEPPLPTTSYIERQHV